MTNATLHFVAENFEAVAHHTGPDGDTSHWVIEPRCLVPCSLQILWCHHTSNVAVWSGKWELLRQFDASVESVPETLALAISLVYSVPGVSVREGVDLEAEFAALVDERMGPGSAEKLKALAIWPKFDAEDE